MISIPIVISLGCIVACSSFQQNLVIEGISLPVDFSSSVNYFPALTAKAAAATNEFLGNYSATAMGIIGKKKSDPETLKIFAKYHQAYVDFTIKPTIADGYLYFGAGNDFDNVPYLFRSNAFFMASLRSGPNLTFEIDPFGKSGSTYFSQLTSCLHISVPRVSATFNSKLNIIKLRVYNSSDPDTELTGYSQELAATYLLHQCSYFAQNVHASAHVSRLHKYISDHN